MICLGIDPGSDTHGLVLFDTDPGPVFDTDAGRVIYANQAATPAEVFAAMDSSHDAFHVAIERFTAGGQCTADIVATIEWGARFYEYAAFSCHPDRVSWLRRSVVLRVLDCNHQGGNRDARVRQALIQRFGGTKRAAVGTKKAPGPLYGVTGHSWQALGVAVAAVDLGAK